MSVNYSSNVSLDHYLINCFQSTLAIINFSCMFAVGLLILLPLLMFVIYLGFQRWRQQRSATSTQAVMSHSDFFTYQMASFELITIMACGFYCFGAYDNGLSLQWVGYYIFSLSITGQSFFHLLTCIERYLAVVHPITYLSLRKMGGVKIRRISTGCVWLFCGAWMGLTQMDNNTLLAVVYFGILVFFLVIICFCTFSMLRVLKHPGPGEVIGERDRVDHSKQRALNTVRAILVALVFRLFGILLCCMMFMSSPLTDTKCAVGSSAMWLAVPGSLVLPLLFLQRAGKLPGCKHNAKSGLG